MTFLIALGKFHSVLYNKSLLSLTSEAAGALPTAPWHSLFSHSDPLPEGFLRCGSVLDACRAGQSAQESTSLGVNLKQRCSYHMINAPASSSLNRDHSEASPRQPLRSLQHALSPVLHPGHLLSPCLSFIPFPFQTTCTQIFVLGSVLEESNLSIYALYKSLFYNRYQRSEEEKYTTLALER